MRRLHLRDFGHSPGCMAASRSAGALGARQPGPHTVAPGPSCSAQLHFSAPRNFTFPHP